MNRQYQKWVAMAMVVSIAINFALAGYILGANNRPPPAFDPTRGFAHWMRTLPDERHMELRGVLRQHRQAGRSRIGNLKQKNTELQHALQAEPFSGKELERVLAQLRVQADEFQQHSHASFAQLVSQLTATERALLAADMQRPKRFQRFRKPNHPPVVQTKQ